MTTFSLNAKLNEKENLFLNVVNYLLFIHKKLRKHFSLFVVKILNYL